MHGHSLIPRLSLCFMNTLNRHTQNTLISCLGFDYKWITLALHCSLADIKFTNSYTQLRLQSCRHLAHKCTQLYTVIMFAPNTTATDGKYWFCLRWKICQGNSEYWVILNISPLYFSFLNNCTSVLHTQISLIGRFHHSLSCWCRYKFT